MYRSGGSSGIVTFIFTDYLSKVSPDWKSRVGSNSAVKWPAGVGAKGSEACSREWCGRRCRVGAFGYVELIYALQNKMEYGTVKNAAGKFLLGTPDGVTAAAAASAKTMPADYRVSITNASGPASYPISSFTYLLIPKPFADPAKAAAMKGFLDLDDRPWRERGYGQGLCASFPPRCRRW